MAMRKVYLNMPKTRMWGDCWLAAALECGREQIRIREVFLDRMGRVLLCLLGVNVSVHAGEV